MRTRRLDASALRAIWFRAHVNSLSADDCRSGRTENAREIPARSPRRAFSVRLRIIAANGDSSNTGKYVSRYVRCRTQGTRLRPDCASQYRCSRAPSTVARVCHPEKPRRHCGVEGLATLRHPWGGPPVNYVATGSVSSLSLVSSFVELASIVLISPCRTWSSSLFSSSITSTLKRFIFPRNRITYPPRYFYEYSATNECVSVSRGAFRRCGGRDMETGARASTWPWCRRTHGRSNQGAGHTNDGAQREPGRAMCERTLRNSNRSKIEFLRAHFAQVSRTTNRRSHRTTDAFLIAPFRPVWATQRAKLLGLLITFHLSLITRAKSRA
jgi:hypothetical protein